jgi:hypothetical protein
MVGRHCCLLETTYTYLSLHVQVLDKYNQKIKIAGLDNMIHILEYAVKMWELPQQYPVYDLIVLGKTSLDDQKIDRCSCQISPHNTNNRADQELCKAKICEMKIVENFKTLTKLAIIDPNQIFDVDNNEDGRYNMVHRYDNIGSSVLQCILLR